MVDPGEEFPESEKPLLRIAEFKQIFDLCSVSMIDNYLEGK